MGSEQNGGQAFPQGSTNYGGMTLRDYFAAKAMQGLLAATANPRFGVTEEPPNPAHWAGFACEAYLLADAMLIERGDE